MQLTIENLIKLIIGVFVFVVVVVGLYFFFNNYVIDFFRGGEVVGDLVLSLIK